MITRLMSIIQRKLLIMMFLIPQALVMIESTHVVGYLYWRKCFVHHHSCADDIRPYRQQLLESETAFCDVCHKNCTFSSRFYFTSRMCTFMSSTCLLVLFVILPILLILVCKCTLLNLMESLKTVISFL